MPCVVVFKRYINVSPLISVTFVTFIISIIKVVDREHQATLLLREREPGIFRESIGSGGVTGS